MAQPRQSNAEPAEGWLRQQLQETDVTQRKQQLLAHVEERMRSILRLGFDQPLDLHKPIWDYGVDSLLAIKFQEAISHDLGISISASLLYDYSTIDALATYLTGCIGTPDAPCPASPSGGN